MIGEGWLTSPSHHAPVVCEKHRPRPRRKDRLKKSDSVVRARAADRVDAAQPWMQVARAHPAATAVDPPTPSLARAWCDAIRLCRRLAIPRHADLGRFMRIAPPETCPGRRSMPHGATRSRSRKKT